MKSRKVSTHVTPLMMAALVIGFGACSARSDSFVVEAEAIPECEGYVAAYQACFPGAGNAQDTRVASIRQNFLAVANRGKEERAQLRETCATGTARLKESCQ